MYTALAVIGFFILYTYLVFPLRMKNKLRSDASLPYVELDPQDIRIPKSVRTRFSITGTVLQNFGYTRVATLAYSTPHMGGTLFISVFRDYTTGDHASIIETINAATAQPNQQIVSFFTDTEDSSNDICTSNMATLSLFPRSSISDSWNFPGLSDIRMLNELHTQHRSLSGRRTKGPIEQILDYAELLRERDLVSQQDFVTRGYYYLDQDANEFRITWKGLYIAAWGLMPPFVGIRRWLVRRKANRILRSLGLPTNYPTESPALEAAKHDNDPTILAELDADPDSQPELEVTPEPD